MACVVFGSEFIALSHFGTGGPEGPSVVTIVSPRDAQIEVTVPVPAVSGPCVSAMVPGVPATFVLAAFDVLQIAADPGCDLSGVTVTLSAPVEVLAGWQYCGIYISAAGLIQEQMLPVPSTHGLPGLRGTA